MLHIYNGKYQLRHISWWIHTLHFKSPSEDCRLKNKCQSGHHNHIICASSSTAVFLITNREKELKCACISCWYRVLSRITWSHFHIICYLVPSNSMPEAILCRLKSTYSCSSSSSGQCFISIWYDLFGHWQSNGILPFWMCGEVCETGPQVLPGRYRCSAFNGTGGTRAWKHMAYDARVGYQNNRILDHWAWKANISTIFIHPNQKPLCFIRYLWQWAC